MLDKFILFSGAVRGAEAVREEVEGSREGSDGE